MSPTGYSPVDVAKPPVLSPGGPAGASGPGWLGRRAIAAIGLYQAARSGRPTGCRYIPTCSEYATEAIREHGSAKGTLIAARRILRCTPWGGHGFDPVPTGRTSCTHR